MKRLSTLQFLFLALGVVLPALAPLSAEVPSGYRRALLVGNSKYAGQALSVGKSLDRVEKALRALGFEVTRRENLGDKAQKAAVDEFALGVPTNGIAVFYFLGLGAHVERQGRLYNLLRPVGEKIGSDNDYRSRGLNVAEVIKTLAEKSGSRLNLLFLDACWESSILPEKGQVKGGLIEFEPGPDTLVLFGAPGGATLPPPGGDQSSALSAALEKNLVGIQASLEKTCLAISAAAGKSWFSPPAAGGIGSKPSAPVGGGPGEGGKAGAGFVNSLGMTFRWCPPGTFTMGSSRSDTAATRDRKAVKVTLTRGFWMGEHEVTQREYRAVLRKNPPPGFTIHKNAPFWGFGEAKKVTDFCKKLSELDRKAGRLEKGWEYFCPTEAEWEYACRAGSGAAYCFGDSVAELGGYANFADKALHQADPDYHWARRDVDDGIGAALAPVGSYRPNTWGLRDMHGNVAELVADHLLPELPGGKDPLARVEKDGQNQVRGGSWCSLPGYCESSFRNSLGGDKRNYVGFRILLKRKN